MFALKAIQSSLTPTKHAIFYKRRITNTKISFVSLCKSKASDSEDSTPEGDARKQELLARIAMLQAQKVRLSDYLDERSDYLTQFAEEVNTEFDKIGEDALKGLDEASARIMENIESRMQDFEESAEMNRQEIVENENKLAEFEGQMEEDRNEGLFFKSLRQKKPVEKAKAKEEMKKIKEVTAQNAGSKTRRNIYLALIGLLVIGIADSFISGSDWRKVAVLGAILVPLLLQFLYEQGILNPKKGCKIYGSKIQLSSHNKWGSTCQLASRIKKDLPLHPRSNTILAPDKVVSSEQKQSVLPIRKDLSSLTASPQTSSSLSSCLR